MGEPGHVTRGKPRLGISACLMGERVRYDGGHKGLGPACALLGEQFELVPVCPEVAIGLGIPRPPLQLVETAGAVRVRGVDDPEFDRAKYDAIGESDRMTLKFRKPIAADGALLE